MKRFTKKDIFTIPNLMSYFRILLIPVFCTVYMSAKSSKDYYVAAGILLVSSLTDMFDGMIARRYNMITELGKAIDPIADKLTHAALAICLAFRYPLMWGVLLLMVMKEGYMAIMGIIFLRHGKMLDGAMWFGKVCTASLFVIMLLLVFLPQLPIKLVNGFIVFMMCMLGITFLLYIPVFKGMRQELMNDRESMKN